MLANGSLRYTESLEHPRDLIADLRRIALDLERQFRQTVDEVDPGPPGGGHGGQWALPGLETAGYVVTHAETALDSAPRQP
jgi:hypothetical protein